MVKQNLRTKIKGNYLLKKFPGKGGWTFAEIPEVVQNKKNPFGWVTITGNIDGYAFEKYKLMPMGMDRLFFPVRKEIRKKIKKEEGDTVYIEFFIDDSPTAIPDYLLECLDQESKAIKQRFMNLKDEEKLSIVKWIEKAKSPKLKADRIVELLKKLS